uniref:Uncharacterized protein n=1 Tax=Heterorhabditis bacteriophora TaxID=37862 RepID=A0A1I7WNH9_HETBA
MNYPENAEILMSSELPVNMLSKRKFSTEIMTATNSSKTTIKEKLSTFPSNQYTLRDYFITGLLMMLSGFQFLHKIFNYIWVTLTDRFMRILEIPVFSQKRTATSNVCYTLFRCSVFES